MPSASIKWYGLQKRADRNVDWNVCGWFSPLEVGVEVCRVCVQCVWRGGEGTGLGWSGSGVVWSPDLTGLEVCVVCALCIWRGGKHTLHTLYIDLFPPPTS